MITENQLNEAIAETYGQRNPDANTCIKLASYYTIKNELYPKEAPRPISSQYSNAAPPAPADGMIDYISDTDFGRSVNGKNVNDVMAKLDEVMAGVYVIDPPLYRRILRDLSE